MAMFGLLTAIEEGDDKQKESFGGVGRSVMGIVFPPLGAYDYWFGASDSSDSSGVAVSWGGFRNKYKKDSIPYQVLDIFADPFMRRAIMASGFASAGVWAMFETKLIENLPQALPDVVL